MAEDQGPETRGDGQQQAVERLPDVTSNLTGHSLRQRPLRLGLTGSIGAGKSTVAALLRARGLSVLDADAVSRELSREPEILAEVVTLLGPALVLCTDGEPTSLNRPAVAALVFADASKRAVLNGIFHPRVRARMAALEIVAASRGERWVVQDVPLLFEGEGWKTVDRILLVDAPLETRLARVVARDGLSRAEVLARDAAQMPAAQKRALTLQGGGVVLDNGGDEAALERQLDAALHGFGVTAPAN